MRRVVLLVCLAVTLSAVVLRAYPPGEPALSALAPPADRQRALVLHAKGVQIYEFRAVPGEPGRYEWVFKAPEADLYIEEGDDKVGRHYAGPTWELSDGGKVVGKLKLKADAPDGKGIPWLLLEATEASGPGVLGKARWVQRIFMMGGQSPQEPADASKVGQERRVSYFAFYVFYVAKP